MILSIESSCDDSSIAITRISDRKLLWHRKISQEIAHSEYGGVVPELASRLHALALPQILEECASYLPQLRAIAVTNEPGLSVTLLEGVAMAKSLALALSLPLIPINHLKGHIYSLFLEQEARFPLDVLLVSGGHTMLLHAQGFESIEIIGASLDDSFGESFDKVAKMLSFGYPGGPIVESCAKKGNPTRFAFSIPLQGKKEVAFSFSGLKNAVRLAVQALGSAMSEQDKCDICASFQHSAVAHLIQKVHLYLTHFSRDSCGALAIVGGASANLALREAMEQVARDFNRSLLLAPLEFCADNAAMIGRVALECYERSLFVDPTLVKVNSRTPTLA